MTNQVKMTNLTIQIQKMAKGLNRFSISDVFQIFPDVNEKEIYQILNFLEKELLIKKLSETEYLYVKFKELIESNTKFDVTLIDPPRKGCDDNAINNVVALTDKYLIYVSCNVSTLARDMIKLMENGFVPEILFTQKQNVSGK